MVAKFALNKSLANINEFTVTCQGGKYYAPQWMSS